MGVLKEVVNETLPLLRDILKAQLPKSIMAHGYVDVMLRYDFREVKTKIFVPYEPSSFKSFIAFTPTSSWEGVQSLSVYYEDKEEPGSEEPDREDPADKELARLLLSLPHLDWTKPVYFTSSPAYVHRRVRRLMRSGRTGAVLQGTVTTPSHAYVFDPKDAPHDLWMAEGYTLSSLSPAHSEWVYDHWFYKYTGTSSLMRSIISKLPTAAAFVTNSEEEGDDLPKSQPVSWVHMYQSGSLGNTFTLPEHRRRGLSKQVTLTLAREVAALGSPAYVNVADDNTASIELHKKLGFRKTVPFIWEIFLPAGVSLEALTSGAARSSNTDEETNVKSQ